MAWTTSVQHSASSFEEPGFTPRLRRPHFLQGLGRTAMSNQMGFTPVTYDPKANIIQADEPPPPPDTTIPAPIDEEAPYDTSGDAPDSPPPDVIVMPYGKEEKKANWVPWAIGGLAAFGIGWVVIKRRRGRR